MHRQLVLFATATALAFAGTAPTHAAGRGAGCFALADAKGDAHAPSGALYQPPATPGIDIQGVTLRSDASQFLVAITVGNIVQQPVSSTSTRFAFDFVLHRRAYSAFYEYTVMPSAAEEKLEQRKGIEVNGEFASDSVQASIAGNTVSIAVPYSTLGGIADKAIRGQQVTHLGASTTAQYTPRLPPLLYKGQGYPEQRFDTAAPPPGLVAVLGAACRRS